MVHSDTIFALASGQGRAGIAVLRLSGPDAAKSLQSLTNLTLPAPRLAARADFHAADGSVIDRGLALWFPAPRSFTGEDVVELHVHGGRAIIAAMAARLGSMPGLRPAEAGEFSRRAFENDKLDLTAAEGLADLVDADTEIQRRQALRQMDGELGRIYEEWRAGLVSALAHVEADIDFPDEDLPAGVRDAVTPKVAALAASIRAHLNDDHRGERLRDGLSIVILGAPNVGKSSLLNRLARRDAAMVSAIAGTTRDVVEVHLDIAGYPVILSDTAGLREAADALEAEGIRRTRERAARADLKLLVLDATAMPANAPEGDANTLIILNKIDMQPNPDLSRLAKVAVVSLSAATGQGVPDLLARLKGIVLQKLSLPATAGITRVRHRQALQDCVAALERFLAAPEDAELAAEDLRLAVRALGQITGRVKVDDILDVVFRDFCIGK